MNHRRTRGIRHCLQIFIMVGLPNGLFPTKKPAEASGCWVPPLKVTRSWANCAKALKQLALYPLQSANRHPFHTGRKWSDLGRRPWHVVSFILEGVTVPHIAESTGYPGYMTNVKHIYCTWSWRFFELVGSQKLKASDPSGWQSTWIDMT